MGSLEAMASAEEVGGGVGIGVGALGGGALEKRRGPRGLRVEKWVRAWRRRRRPRAGIVCVWW